MGARAAGWRRGRDLPGIGSMPAVALKQSLALIFAHVPEHTLSVLKGILFSAAALLLLSPEVCARLWPLCADVAFSLSVPLTSAVIADQLCYGRVEPSRRVVCVARRHPSKSPPRAAAADR